MIKFRQKDFSNYILGDAIKGAGIGLSVGTTAASLGATPEKFSTKIPGAKWYNDLKPKKEKYKRYNNDGKDLGWEMEQEEKIIGYDRNSNKPIKGWVNTNKYKMRPTPPGATITQKWAFGIGATILGAALGAIVGAIRTGAEKYSQRNTNQRLLKRILPILKSKGYVEGKDFTMDPKRANEIPTKVCIVLSSASGELQTVINSRDDRNLRSLVKQISSKHPRTTQSTTQNDKFNEITITTEKNTAANVSQVVSIIESFVENGYPVYIVEVG